MQFDGTVHMSNVYFYYRTWYASCLHQFFSIFFLL